MPPLRPPGVGEPTVPMTRSASAERAFCFGAGASTCRPFPCCLRPAWCCLRPFPCCLRRPTPCCPLRPSLYSVLARLLPRARPFWCSPCPPVAVYLCAARASLSHAVRASLSHAVRAHLFLRSPSPPIPCCPCPSVPLLRVAVSAVSGAEASGRRLRCVCRSFGSSPRGSIYIGAAEKSNGSTTERRLDRQKPGFCGTAGCAGCRSRTGALSSRRRYFCGKLL